MRTFITCMALIAALAGAAGAEIVGEARVVDGDTLAIGALMLRLHGADAPESAQTCGGPDGVEWACGEAAAARLAELAGAGDLSCEALDRDAYDRVIARCSAGGRDLGATLVAEGLAWAYVRYSSDYTGAEAEAQAARRGVWQGPSQAAWDWRRHYGFQAAAGGAEPRPTPKAEAPAATAPAGCAIKGNVNAKGERIYHTPDSPWYARVRMAPTRGQRWFCDEAEAIAAGWRAAGGARP